MANQRLAWRKLFNKFSVTLAQIPKNGDVSSTEQLTLRLLKKYILCTSLLSQGCMGGNIRVALLYKNFMNWFIAFISYCQLLSDKKSQQVFVRLFRNKKFHKLNWTSQQQMTLPWHMQIAMLKYKLFLVAIIFFEYYNKIHL